MTTSPWPTPTSVDGVWISDLTAYPKPPARERAPYAYRATVPPLIAGTTPELSLHAVAALDAATVALALLNADQSNTYGLVAVSLLRVEAVSSSRIEGLKASHRAIAEAREVPSSAKTLALEVAGNVHAMEHAIDLADAQPFSVNMMKSIHETLAEGSPSLRSVAGVVRDRQNWIGPSNHGPFNAIYVPPPPSEIGHLLSDLVDFARRTDFPPILQAGIVHAQFEAIHPFGDGNGRVGRALIHVILRQRMMTPLAIPPISATLVARRDGYHEALRRYQQEGDLNAWMIFFANATTEAARRALELSREVNDLLEDWSERLGPRRSGAAVTQLLRILLRRPVLTAAGAAEAVGISETASRRALLDLEAIGIVKQITVGRRNRVWEAGDVFDLLDRFEHDAASSGGGQIPAPSRHLRRDEQD